MQTPGNDLLLLAGKVLTLLMQGVMAIAAVVIAITLPAALLFGTEFGRGFSDGSDIPFDQMPMIPVAGLLITVFAITVALFFFFAKLRAIINTVGAGDPFVPANAERLNLMAWLLLAAQLLTWPAAALGMIVAEWADKLEGVNVTADLDGFDLTGILMVIILFILARVFRHGAAMREDLEGTV